MISREAALALLRQYNQEPFHIQHALTVEAVMRWFANDLGYGEEADFWAMCGLLHDIDFEKWPEQHCVKAPELLRPAHIPWNWMGTREPILLSGRRMSCVSA